MNSGTVSKGNCPVRIGDPGCSARDNRLFVEAVLWISRSGSPWRELPRRFGKWYSAYTRYRRWSQTGEWNAMFAALSDDLDFEFALIDETICLRPVRTLNGGKLRNYVIEQMIKELEQLEHKFRDSDPVREAIAVARHTAARHFIAPAQPGGPSPTIIK